MVTTVAWAAGMQICVYMRIHYTSLAQRNFSVVRELVENYKYMYMF